MKAKMTDYSLLTNEELLGAYNKLVEVQDMELSMDGSGDLYDIILKGFEPYFNAMIAEFEKRGIELEVEESEIPF